MHSFCSYLFSFSHPTEFDLLKSRAQLAEFYQTTMSQVQMAPWDPNDTVHIDEVYTRLSWCREDKHPSGTEEQELGDYTDIFHGHKNYPNPKKIVVVGQGGIGKSTFSQKLAVDWAKGEKEALKKFDLLLVIKLRDVCGIGEFNEILLASGLLPFDESAQVDCLHHYILEHQDRVLILFDGYDEYDRAQDTTSDVYKIIAGKMLRGCHVVVTSRPSKVDQVKKFMHTQCKIRGFTYWDIGQFASRYVGEGQSESFINYLLKQDIIGMASIPLMLLFLCLLWKGRKAKPLPRSRTQLYEEVVQCIIDHCYTKVSPDNLKSVDECSVTLCKIGKVAFEALLRDSLVFDSAQLPREVLSDEAVRLGFLSTSKVQHGRSKLMASFFHKSVQEFLAAWYIAKEAIPRGTNDFLSPICDFATFKGLEDFLSFVCGLSTEAANAVFAHLKSIAKNEDLVPSCSSLTYCVDFTQNQKKFGDWCFQFFSALDHKEDIAAAYLDCVDGVVVFKKDCYSQELRQLVLSVLPLLLHHENLIQLQLPALGHLTLCVEGSLTKAKDEITFLTALGGVFSVLDDVDVKVVTCTSGESCMTGSDFITKMITQGLYGIAIIFWLVRKGPVLYLCPQDLEISTLDDFDWFFGQFLPPAADQSGSQAQASEHDASEDVLPCHVLSLTKHLRIYGIHNRLIEVLCLLQYAINISHLTLVDLGMSKREAAVLVANLQNHDVGPVVRRTLSECLSSVPQLVSLNLTDTKMGEKEVVDLAKVIKNVSQLKLLDLSGNHLGPAVSVLSECLSLVPQLVSLNLANAKIGEKEIKALAKALKNVPQFQVLSLNSNPLGPGVSVLACHLQSVPNLEYLYLQKTSMTEREAADLAKALQHVPLLRDLWLSENPIGCGLIPLAENLVHVPQLRSLRLDKTNMTEREAADLAKALQHVPLLEWLFVDFNPLGHGAITLAQAVIHAMPELSLLSLEHIEMDAECEAALKRSAQQHRKIRIS